MSSKLQVDIVTNARGVGPGVDQAESKLSKLGSIGKKAGKVAAAGLAVAGAAAVKMGLDSIGAASNVEQSFGALETIYGKNADRVKKWAGTAAESVGLAKSEYANMSALVGSQLQGMGVEQEKSAKRSDKLIRLGSDLAATYGGSVSDAVGAVSSLLKGEADPIERYGVSIKQSDVNARLAAEGLDQLEGKAAKTAEAQARLALLNEQTAKATGAFARESSTLAGQQERLGAKFENLKATLGEKLLPVATRVVTWVSEKMLPGAQRLGTYLAQKFGPTFARVGAFISEQLVPAARRFYDWFVEKIAPGIKRTVTPIIEGAKKAFDRIRNAISDNEPELRKFADFVQKIAEWVADKLLPKLGDLVGFLAGRFGTQIGGAIDKFSSLVGWISDGVGAVKDLIDWLGKIKVPDIPGLDKLGGLAGSIFGSNDGVVTVGARLTGGTGSLDGRRGFTSAAMTPSTWSSVVATSAAPTGPAHVDARTYLTVQVDGSGVVDEQRIAQQLVGVLDRYATRMGRPAAAWAPAI